jgi:hypothetical protein
MSVTKINAMKFRKLVIMFLILLNHQVYASNICEELKKSPKSPIQIEYNGQLTKRINLGSLEAQEHTLHPSHMGVFVNKKYPDAQGDCPRSCISLEVKSSPCKGWNYFDGKIEMEPAVFGPGHFEDTFTLTSASSKPADYDEGLVSLEFSVSGTFHGGLLGVNADKRDVESWFAGRTSSLTLTIVNNGDRVIHIKNMEIELSDLSDIKGIPAKLSNDKCSSNVLEPNQRCTIVAISDTKKLIKSKKAMYIIFFGNDAIGSGNAQVFIDRDSEPQVSIHTGYSSQ